VKTYLFTTILLMVAIFKLVAFYLNPNKKVKLLSIETEPWVYILAWSLAGILALLGIINQYRSTKL